MRYFLIFGLLFSSLLAHGANENHLHFFSSWHVEEFVLLIVSLTVGLSIFKYLTKETN